MQTITISTPSENLIVSQNGNQPQPPSSELEKLLQANTTLAVWLIFLAIGGGLLARYYLKIGYLPEMEWNAALVYLFVCSVWGGVIGLLLTISLYLPGVIWSEIIIFETILDDYLTYRAPHDDASGRRSRRKEPCIRGIMIWLGILFFAALILSHLCLLASKPDVNRIDFYYWFIAGLLLLETFFVMRLILKFLLKSKKDTKTIRRQVFRYSTWFTLSVLLNQIAMYVIYRLVFPLDRHNFYFLTGLGTAFVWISTHIVAVRHRDYPRQALVAALVAASVLLFTADRFSDLSMKLMSRYGVGEIKKYDLIVTKDTVELVHSDGVPICGPQLLCNVQILSKMGDHYFVRVNDDVCVTLPKKDVIAIRRLEIVEGAKN